MSVLDRVMRHCTRNRAARGSLAVFVLIGVVLAAVTLDPTAASADERCVTQRARSLPINARPAPVDPTTTAAGPPANPEVGDEWLWYTWRLNGFPVADILPATVRGKGQHCYVVVENSQWNVNVNQAQVDHIVERFDQLSIGTQPDLGIYDLNVQTFGIPPDRLDNDDRIYIYYYDFDVSSDGFFWVYDEYPDGTQPFASNECEVVYINCSDNDPAGDYLIAVVAHEFEHMIHWEHDPNEASWVDEGLAELAMWLYGRPDVISAFNTNPDNNLTTFNGAWADYIKTYLWSLYYYERYGGAPAIYDVVHEPANSVLGYENVLDAWNYTEDFADVFADWVVANYLDDPSLGDGRWGYVGDDLPPFSHAATHATYPVGPLSAFVNHWATDYVRFSDALSGLTLGFDGNDATSYAVWALELDPVESTRVSRVPLDPGQAGTVQLPDVGDLYDEAILVVANNATAGSSTYAYEAQSGTTGLVAAEASPAAFPVLHAPVPNPFNPSVQVRYQVPAAATSARLVVADATGRHVRTLFEGPATAGSGTATWNGRTDGGRETASGVYFFRLETDAGAATGRAVLMR